MIIFGVTASGRVRILQIYYQSSVIVTIEFSQELTGSLSSA